MFSKKITFLLILFVFSQHIFTVPITSNWTGVCIAIQDFLEEKSDKSSTIEYLETSSIMEFENGTFAQRVKFRNNSVHGNSDIFNFIFLMSGDKENAKVLTYGKPEDFASSVINNSFRIRALYDSKGKIILN